jgi:hypothetical protein
MRTAARPRAPGASLTCSRTFSITMAIAVSMTAALTASLGARAASGACSEDVECAAPQVCHPELARCVWHALDRETLIAAIDGANGDEAPDVIVLGPRAQSAEVFEIDLAAPAVNDAAFGPIALPVIASAITIRGLGSDRSVIDIDADVRLFVLAPSAQGFRPELVLQRVTIKDARPGPNAAGQIVGAGAVTVTSQAAGTALPILVTEDVLFTNCRGAAAGAVHNEGAPARFTRTTFDRNSAEGGAGAVATASGGSISSCTFTSNIGRIGAVDASEATRLDDGGATVDAVLSIAASTFRGNRGQLAGAVRSLATTTVGNSTFIDNGAAGELATGGAVAGRSLRVGGATFERNFARHGGALATLDEPAGAAALVTGSFFDSNQAFDAGGAVFAGNAPITLADNVFIGNRARRGGGAVALVGIVERNGDAPNATLRENIYSSNIVRPTATLVASDRTLDERGTDLGSAELRIEGSGSALLVDATSDVVVSGSCLLGNTAAAVALVNGAAGVSARGNWWGDATGAGPAGGGDTAAGAGLDVSDPLAQAPELCAGSVRSYPRIFVRASVSTDSALIATDYRLLDAVRRIQVLNGPTGDLIPDMRTGRLPIEVVGVNDDLEEGPETFTLRLERCGDPCDYLGEGNDATFTITDNGDGRGGEGEGEGEPDCLESLQLSAATLLLPSTGEDSEAVLRVTNRSACDVKLFRPLLRAGASRGFAVRPILLSALQLDEGDSIDITVTFAPVEDDREPTPPTGRLFIESERGTVIEVGLALEGGDCACASTTAAGRTGVAAGPIAFLAVIALLGARGRRRDPPR